MQREEIKGFFSLHFRHAGKSQNDQRLQMHTQSTRDQQKDPTSIKR
jgi:hypothetical protein